MVRWNDFLVEKKKNLLNVSKDPKERELSALEIG